MTRRKIAVIALTAAGLVAAAVGVWRYPVYRVERIVGTALRDPDSAKFQKVEVFYGTGAACGWVNARNGLGGYVGFTHFTMSPDGSVEFDPRADSERGSLEERLAAVQKNIAYQRKALANCPEPDAPAQ